MTLVNFGRKAPIDNSSHLYKLYAPPFPFLVLSHPFVVLCPHLHRQRQNSLLDSWDTLVVSVSNSAPNGDLTLQVVKDCLLNEESRRKEQAFSTEQNALVTENSDRRGRNKNRGPQHQRDKSRGKSKFKEDFKCHYCGGPNHYERDCRNKKRDQNNGNNENKKDDKDTTAVATDGDVVIICDDACVSSSCQETDWIIDSGASYHITPHRDMFTSYTSGNFGRVRMANHGVTEVIGMGNINLETDTGCRLILRDVRYIPNIRLNIISTGKLDDDGYVSHFGEGKWKLTKGSLITAKSKKKNSLYLMQAKLSNGEVNAAVNNFSIELWHKRLGHLSQKGMQLLAKKKLLPDDEQNDITDDEPVDDQVRPIQTDDPVPPPEARVRRSTRQTRPSTRYNPDEVDLNKAEDYIYACLAEVAADVADTKWGSRFATIIALSGAPGSYWPSSGDARMGGRGWVDVGGMWAVS
ncbi:hypothetical protein BUALT_Bualt16G0028600 [Buddleja alternifolia]|uniref:CCHC-type domain-containing protein n=1 Tax=Buddleja alternifolia TaxID=168488 RepID=A0AAV6WF52_9LAMI|nr:hypothetical protein BUALT_Bualt16G0028600 [Buddleja alternifolia]